MAVPIRRHPMPVVTGAFTDDPDQLLAPYIWLSED
jgi:hypothetical protein